MGNQPLNDKIKAMEQELIRRHGMANQLLELLVHKSNTHHHHGDEEALILPLAQDLVCKVLISFTNSLLLLNTDVEVFEEEVVPNSIVRGFSSSANCTKPEDMNEPCKGSNAKNRRRGCYKRKLNTQTWEMDSSILTEDGHAWRKYGQKMTTNAKYLRSYYRCTHKHEQGCPAIKQVQRIQEDPPLYRTTYYGHHTCKSSFIPDIILEPDSSSSTSILLSFNNSLPLNKQEQTFSSPHLELAKQEPMEVIQDEHIPYNQLSSLDYLLSCDYVFDFNYSGHVTMLSSTESVLWQCYMGTV